MNHRVRHKLRLAFPAWAVAVMVPAPAVVTARHGSIGLVYFFVGSMWLVADIFSRSDDSLSLSDRGDTWRDNLAAAAIALLLAWVVMAGMCMTLPQPAAVVAAALASLAIIPVLGIVPCIVSLVGNPYFAVVLSLTLVACMKLLGCVVVVFVYGWDACERGYTTMPWTEPNLLVWSFLVFTAALSAACCWMGFRRSHQCCPAAMAGSLP